MKQTRFMASTLGVAILLASAAGAQAECLIYRSSIELGMDLSVQMMAPSGKDCRLNFPLRERAVIDVNQLTTHPRYGGARIDGFSGAYYRSNPGYRGPDRFAFQFCGRDRDKTGCTRVQVKVDVR